MHRSSVDVCRSSVSEVAIVVRQHASFPRFSSGAKEQLRSSRAGRQSTSEEVASHFGAKA